MDSDGFTAEYRLYCSLTLDTQYNRQPLIQADLGLPLVLQPYSGHTIQTTVFKLLYPMCYHFAGKDTAHNSLADYSRITTDG